MAAPSKNARIWVLPNRHTPGLAAVLLAMWYAGASQSNGAAYLLCFVLAALALVSIVHARANLRGVEVSAGAIPPAFAGEQIAVPLALRSTRSRALFAVRVFVAGEKIPALFDSVPPSGVEYGSLPFTARQRGCFHELPLRLASLFPLGFFTARRRIALAQTHYVYPAPTGTAPLPRALAPTLQPRDGTRIAGDDFGGVRAWRPGESQRHIDWKAAARGQPLLTKQWTGEADDILRFAWDDLPSLGVEARLSQFARWIVLAERGASTYALHLPGETIPASRGDAHYHRCLRALALFPEEAR